MNDINISSILPTIFHISLAVAFFYMLNWVGRHTVSLGYVQLSVLAKTDEAPAYNFILRTLSPTVYILILSIALYSLNYDQVVMNIWLVVVYYFVFRVAYNCIMGRYLLMNWKMVIFQGVVAIPVSYLVYKHIILVKQNLFPELNAIGNELWLITMLFLYATFNNIQTSGEKSRQRKSRYIAHEYKKYNVLFSNLIEKSISNKILEALVYAIMIYEAFGRPKIVRIVERLVKAKTLGVMQVAADKRISDEESVVIAIEKIDRDYDATVSAHDEADKNNKRRTALSDGVLAQRREYTILRQTVAQYNADYDYISEVMHIHKQITDMFYTK